MPISADCEFDLDDSEFPLVRLLMPRLHSVKHVEAYYEDMTRLAQRGRFGLIVDVRRTRFATLAQGSERTSSSRAKTGTGCTDEGRSSA